MTSNGVRPTAPDVVRRLDTASSASLVHLVEMFEDLQMVLRCCERLVAELVVEEGAPEGVPEGVPDGVLVEAAWSMALLSYARCFAVDEGGVTLTEDDLAEVQPGEEVLQWHRLLLELRDHYADPITNPRERFSVGVTQDAEGQASGVAITSVRQPMVDDLTVRQTGAVAYALSGLVNGRIEALQEQVFAELKDLPAAELEKLVQLDVTQPSTGA
jgi:hypothetical protein